MTTDTQRKKIAQMALDDVSTCLATLQGCADDQKRPTIKQLNDLLIRLANAKRFLNCLN